MILILTLIIVVLILLILEQRRKMRIWETASRAIAKRGFDLGVKAEKARVAKPLHEREKDAYLAGLQDGRAAMLSTPPN